MRKIPWLTVLVFALTAAVSGWAAADPGVMRALERDPAGLAPGHWWRLASPLLVQSDGAAQLVFNLVTLAAFGVLAERWLGRPRWLGLYLGAGLLGQALGYAWEPPGGGNSVAVCGLVGGIAAAALLRRPPMPEIAALLTAYYGAALAGLQLGGGAVQVVALIAVGVLGAVLHRAGRPALAARVLAALALLAGMLLLAARDHHGPSLLFGVLVGLLTAGPGRFAGKSNTPAQTSSSAMPDRR